jgi:uncharacterized protein YegL
VPKRAAGICPASTSSARYEKQECNVDPCVGDEVCIAKMDVVLAIDGSGSFTEKGFKVLQSYALEIVKRLRSEAFGREAVHLGIVQFGNGKVSADGLVSDASEALGLTPDLAAAETALRGLTFQRGFTNLAQAMLKSKDVLAGSERVSAERVVLLLTDGRPTFKQQARSAIEMLRESARVVVVHIKAFPAKADTELLRSFASVPWRSNYLHIAGKKTLKHATAMLAEKTIVQFCPKVQSDSKAAELAALHGFRLIREAAMCDGTAQESSVQTSPAACKAFADEGGTDWTAFAYGGSCEVFRQDCKTFSRNVTYNVYERARTAQDKLLDSG